MDSDSGANAFPPQQWGGGIMLLPSVPLHGCIRRATVGQANSSFQVDILAS